MITRLAISGYRSIRELVLAPGPLTIVTGANGAGKSSLYRALRLLADVAQGRIVQSLALEGGLDSTLWAGPEKFSRAMKAGEEKIQGLVRQAPKGVKLGFASDAYGYAIDLGPSSTQGGVFGLDPEIKVEAQWTGDYLGRSNLFAERRGPGVRIRDENGGWRQAAASLAGVDSMMTHCADIRSAYDLAVLRETMRRWRFYDNLRADREAPARRPQIGTYTPALADDGADLAAALATIMEIGEAEALRETIGDAFPGSRIDLSTTAGYFETLMRQHGLLRPLRAAELSEGTLRYLLLVAALLTPRPPPLMVFNEPESSLHPSLIGPLARLMLRVAKNTQLVVVSHSAKLVSELGDDERCVEIALEKQLGETLAPAHDKPKWVWPSR
ncbi:AAA family ATPase [Methylocystis parvus]|uniref:AAA family ATPase n=1 Tax=Methylocystis parvus TaxID=134 RepID=A0A6B8M5C6_9HYPH|nr:AAA family ATPase [Methylocystis parvus]QGM96533.1 AAA family ATPase [Methylocystis parvus]WBJ99615.1 AAA family ATPase [Methylocystis parvus OBBP]